MYILIYLNVSECQSHSPGTEQVVVKRFKRPRQTFGICTP